MIFYFSGTGNSLWVAKQIGQTFDERLVSIVDELKKPSGTCTYTLEENEKIFFVFPVHSWGPAVLVPRFIARLNLKNYANQAVYAVCVCGDNCGYADRIMQKALSDRSIRLTETCSVQMPNNYILMKGFGIDDKETEKKKLAFAPQLIKEITENIRKGERLSHYVAGGKPFVKSRIVYPLFCKFALRKNLFYATDACTSCGLCVKICPTGTISMKDGHPIWGNSCVQCTACIHRCPARAIEYGKITQTQGRYHHPEQTK